MYLHDTYLSPTLPIPLAVDLAQTLLVLVAGEDGIDGALTQVPDVVSAEGKVLRGEGILI